MAKKRKRKAGPSGGSYQRGGGFNTMKKARSPGARGSAMAASAAAAVESDAAVAGSAKAEASLSSANQVGPSASVVKLTDGTKEKHDPRLIIVLEKANLETVKTSRGLELLNCDDHLSLHRKFKKDPKDSRPDILHQCLLTLLDSPLNKAGLLKVYVRSNKNVLIDVAPTIRIPRTFKRFAGLMVQLLHKLKIRSASSSTALLKVIQSSSLQQRLPMDALKYSTAVTGKLVDAYDFVKTLPKDKPTVFVFGAMAHGVIDDVASSYCDGGSISLSKYPLSGAYALSRLLNAYEHHLGVL